MFLFLFPAVPAEILKSSLTTMERHIQRLENDIENFPKTDDQQDKFVEKMSISFLFWSFPHHAQVKILFALQQHGRWSIWGYSLWYIYIFFSIALAKVYSGCAVPGSRHFKSLGVIGGTLGTIGNGSGCLAVKCWSDLPLHSCWFPKSKIMLVAIFLLHSATAACPPGGL